MAMPEREEQYREGQGRGTGGKEGKVGIPSLQGLKGRAEEEEVFSHVTSHAAEYRAGVAPTGLGTRDVVEVPRPLLYCAHRAVDSGWSLRWERGEV